MRSINLFIFLIVFTSLLLSCREGNDRKIPMEHICIPFNQIMTLNVGEGELIPLETTDESLVSYVTNVEINDDELILSSGNSVLKFDTKGRYLSNIGALGHSNREYLDTRNMFISENHICVFDWSSHKVNFYDASGKYLSRIDIQPNDEDIYPSTLYKLNDGTFLSNNCYQGSDVSTPAFSVFSPSGELLYHIKGLKKKDGTTHNELRYSTSTNTLLYAEAFCDTIYRVLPNEMKAVKAYYIDFGEHKFTEEEKSGKDFVDMCAYSNIENNIKTKASTIYCCYETVDKMMFVFVYQKIHFVIYDKNKHSIRVYRLEDKSNRLNPLLFAKYTDDEVFFLCEDLENINNNPVLVKMPYKTIF